MTRFGHTLMTEQSGPEDLVRSAVGAEEAGSDLAVSSDRCSPWPSAQGPTPRARSVRIGGDAQEGCLEAARSRILPALREAAPVTS